MDVRLPLKIALLTAIGLWMASEARAERFFASERGLAVDAVPGAASYEWERFPGGTMTVTAGPSLRVYQPWRSAYRWRVRALPVAGSSQPAGEWSNWSEDASWWRDVNFDADSTVRAGDVSACASLFGWTLTGGEWIRLNQP